jgi:hypothetical protein
MKFIKIIIIAGFLSGCASAPPSVVGLYGPEPVKQDIAGSNAQAIVDRTVEFTKDEVFDATKSAMLRLGYNVEVSNKKEGMVAASGFYTNCGGNKPPVTMAVYIKQVSKKPETKLTILLDRHDYQCWGAGETMAANQLAGEIQKILSTY